MRIYQAKLISGFYIGQFRSLKWTDREPFLLPKEIGFVLGIPEDVQLAYLHYLARLGTHTFGYFDGIPTARPPERRMVEEFMKFHLYKLWAKYGRYWRAVGATVGRFDREHVIWQQKFLGLHWASRVLWPYDIIMRYRERLWWGRSVFIAAENEWMYEQGPPIGDFLMFELRGSGVARKNEDEWNFGMLWWEVFGVPGRFEVYLWANAEVRYLGFGIRRSPTLLSLQHEK